MAINTFIIKNASRCNLNCSYCYMYNMGDDTYKSQPKKMSIETIVNFASKLKKYVDRNSNLNSIYLAFHGGEPLLSKKTFFRKAVQIFTKTVSGINLNFIMQTNGTLLDDEWCKLLKELNIQVSISIDGPRKYHNEFRIYHNGESSFNEVFNGVKKRNQYGIGGIISVINVEINVHALYSFYQEINPKVINLLLPNSNHDNKIIQSKRFKGVRYGDWLIELYEIWKSDNILTRPQITFFSNIIGIILGNEIGDETIGKVKCSVAVIETDGSLEVVDPLRTCGNGFTRNNLNIEFNEIADLEEEPLYQVYHNSHFYLPEKCMGCAIKDICGGGYLIHRYSMHKGFNNESIYCQDLMKLISHIQNDIVDSLPSKLKSALGINKVDYELLKDAKTTPPKKHTVGFEYAKFLESFKKENVVENEPY